MTSSVYALCNTMVHLASVPCHLTGACGILLLLVHASCIGSLLALPNAHRQMHSYDREL